MLDTLSHTALHKLHCFSDSSLKKYSMKNVPSSKTFHMYSYKVVVSKEQNGLNTVKSLLRAAALINFGNFR